MCRTRNSSNGGRTPPAQYPGIKEDLEWLFA
jgi:hypothetical protein